MTELRAWASLSQIWEKELIFFPHQRPWKWDVILKAFLPSNETPPHTVYCADSHLLPPKACLKAPGSSRWTFLRLPAVVALLFQSHFTGEQRGPGIRTWDSFLAQDCVHCPCDCLFNTKLASVRDEPFLTASPVHKRKC